MGDLDSKWLDIKEMLDSDEDGLPHAAKLNINMKKNVKEENFPVIGQGMMAQIQQTNKIKYSSFDIKKLKEMLERVSDKKGVELKNETKIQRRNIPWECNKKQ